MYRTSLLKAHSDNSIDAAFGLEGWIKPYVGSFFKTLLVQGTQLLALGGDFSNTIALARFNVDGTLDPSFGDLGGFTHTAVGSLSTNPGGMAVQPDGRILVVGTAVNNNNDVVVARYNGSVVGVHETAGGATLLQVYPNPASDDFTVSWNMPGLKDTEVVLYDATGRMVLRKTVGDDRMNARIRVEELAPGEYLCELRAGAEVIGRSRLMVVR